jgi:glycerol uptake operon antiterminator
MTAHAPPRTDVLAARIERSPFCPAVVAADQLEAALASPAAVIFLLRGNGLEMSDTVRRVHDAGKLVAVHLDLVDGLRADHWGVTWLARSGVDAIITSHGQLMSVIRQEGATAIHRLLLSRRSHVDTAVTALLRARPDIVEILPGVILPAVTDLLPPLDIPLLAGGFVRTAADARAAMAAGAIGVTTSSRDLWAIDVA